MASIFRAPIAFGIYFSAIDAEVAHSDESL